MSFDPEKLVHDPRAEELNDRTVGRDFIFTPRGEYVGESRVNIYQDDSNELEIRVKAEPRGQDEWTDFLSGQEVVETGTNEVPGFDENFLGEAERGDIDSYRENRWAQFQDDRYDVHVENIGGEVPGVLQVYGDGDAQEFVDAAASYAADLAYVNLEAGSGHGNSGTEEIWSEVFADSLHQASERRKKIIQRS
jgi:hypothetical protein